MPLQSSKRRPTESVLRSQAGTGRPGKSLFSPWTDTEGSALIQFVLLPALMIAGLLKRAVLTGKVALSLFLWRSLVVTNDQVR